MPSTLEKAEQWGRSVGVPAAMELAMVAQRGGY